MTAGAPPAGLLSDLFNNLFDNQPAKPVSSS